MFRFELHHTDGHCSARRSTFHTPHGPVELPAFMPVGTQAAIKGLTIDQVRNAISRQNIEIPGGSFTAGRSDYTMRTMGRVNDPSEETTTACATPGTRSVNALMSQLRSRAWGLRFTAGSLRVHGPIGFRRSPFPRWWKAIESMMAFLVRSAECVQRSSNYRTRVAESAKASGW